MEKKLKYLISVDTYKGNGQININYKSYASVRDNNSGDLSNSVFKIEVPKSGSFLVTVTIDAIDCFKFADGKSCQGYNNGRFMFMGSNPSSQHI